MLCPALFFLSRSLAESRSAFLNKNLLRTLSPEQEEVLTKYCDEIFASGAETEEFSYRLVIKDGLRLKSTVKSVLETMS